MERYAGIVAVKLSRRALQDRRTIMRAFHAWRRVKGYKRVFSKLPPTPFAPFALT